MRAIAQVLGGGFCLLALLVLSNWSSVVSMSIQHDLDEYGRLVRASKRSVGEKERLLDVIDSVEEKLDLGAVPSMRRWLRHDSVIRAMLARGITPDEVRLIERELQKFEKELEDE